MTRDSARPDSASLSTRPDSSPASGFDIVQIVEQVANVLPEQGPIGIFIHHNTLHAFEHLPFEEAVVRAGRRFGCEPFLAEDVYREELRRGRISERDVASVLDAALASQADEPIVGGIPRRELWRRMLLEGIPEARGTALQWLLSETDAVATQVDLWTACIQAVARTPERSEGAGANEAVARTPERSEAPGANETVARTPERSEGPGANETLSHGVRHRDLVLALFGMDPNDWVRPVLIRFIGAYLDQGFAHWPMPEKERGIFACFQQVYGRPLAVACGRWAALLPRLVADDRAACRGAAQSLVHSLTVLGVSPPEWQEFLTQEALWLRGWAGMVRQLETRPDRAPARPLPARLLDYLAVQLLLSRAALSHAARIVRIEVPMSELRSELRARLQHTPPTMAERAWPLFHVARLCGLSAARIAASAESEIASLERELVAIDGPTRRRLLHQAYEQNLRHRFYDALVQNIPDAHGSSPAFQAVFCIDEREESFRRHLEEVEPRAETYAIAGFFGVAIYYQGAHAAHARPLCPIVVKPEHYVFEGKGGTGASARRRQLRRMFAGLVDKNIHIGSRTFGRGAVIAALLGTLWIVPLVLRVLFPWARRGMSHLSGESSARAGSRLRLERTSGTPPLGKHSGFTVDEMADIVRAQLLPTGIIDRLAPLVFVLGHGSTSLNNPHESAHDCGACGGGQGGPNARAFAQMANDFRVRERLELSGLRIPARTWFIGGQRNSANNDVDLYDEDVVPEGLRDDLEKAKRTFEIARRREAHERCRRFESAPPSWLPDGAALLHVQARSADLAQPRPEYGHASNAVCLVGRRSRTRGLFLDRRAFLVSYDPEHDSEGATLARLLAAVTPVLAGINLEYLFGYVDPSGYGCGTKLPHNVTGMLGVMDGAQSDLRTGLPWQMLEIHEPVRLALVVETTPAILQQILVQDARLARLVRGRWLFLAALHPHEQKLFEIDRFGVRPFVLEQSLPIVRGPSRTYYAGRRGHLPFVRLDVRERDVS